MRSELPYTWFWYYLVSHSQSAMDFQLSFLSCFHINHCNRLDGTEIIIVMYFSQPNIKESSVATRYFVSLDNYLMVKHLLIKVKYYYVIVPFILIFHTVLVVLAVAIPQANLLQRCPIAMVHLLHVSSKSRKFTQNCGNKRIRFCFKLFSSLSGNAGEYWHPITVYLPSTSSPKYE